MSIHFLKRVVLILIFKELLCYRYSKFLHIWGWQHRLGKKDKTIYCMKPDLITQNTNTQNAIAPRDPMLLSPLVDF